MPAASWYRTTDDARVTERESDFAEVKVTRTNPDVVLYRERGGLEID